MPTLKDIAERVGVSISTVSRVLADESNRAFNSETRQKIWEAARDLGYSVKPPAPESAAAVKSIGCIVSTMQDRHYHPYFSVIFEGIEKELSRNGYKIAFTFTQEDLKRPEILRQITMESSIEGLIIIEGIENKLYNSLKKHVKHIVGIDVSDPDIPTISYDRVEAARIAVKHLIDQGHREIMFIGGTGLSGEFEREKRYRGYKLALEQAGLAIQPQQVLNAEWEPNNAYHLVLRYIDEHRGQLPTAVFAASDIMAMAAMRAIAEKGFRMPQDFAVIGFDDNEPSRYTVPPLSTIHIPTFEIGNVAARTLVQSIQHPYPLPIKILLPFEPIFRQSSTWQA
ncbi:LacI family DNA-binding transcriptional regulator [Paenibacillus albidus]|uniref:LacI family DNA-binding transcriptional regulator n=1 Tax=Paenibacillus albidus TaxID=2041023 RepID=UPI001BE9EF7F|nr:LacI family DNA-binding transcriptional regulator [Paenibacillus albidus]MBT2291148.1 LacI family DNA-binding transcriptional regulator [Paenibacillus albidus]